LFNTYLHLTLKPIDIYPGELLVHTYTNIGYGSAVWWRWEYPHYEYQYDYPVYSPMPFPDVLTLRNYDLCLRTCAMITGVDADLVEEENVVHVTENSRTRGLFTLPSQTMVQSGSQI